tara:strand:- start:487 stop:663 length:177 start_codon:yes stop_codon:yes gene_type:complete
MVVNAGIIGTVIIMLNAVDKPIARAIGTLIAKKRIKVARSIIIEDPISKLNYLLVIFL